MAQQRNLTPEQRRKMFMRRRIAALVVLGLAIWLVVALLSAVFGFIGGLFHHGSATPAASQSASPSANATGALTVCAPGTVTVTAFIGDGKSSFSSFAPGVNPKLWFTLNNTGTVSCTFNAGSAVQFFTITSGAETIWTSKQCDRSHDSDAIVTLEPSVALRSTPSAWVRVRSSETGCGANQTQAIAGGASYHVKAQVNGVISNDVQFILN